MFVRGLTSNHKEVLLNPELILYVYGIGRNKSAVVLAHSSRRLILDQDPQMVEQRFEEFYKEFFDAQSADNILN